MKATAVILAGPGTEPFPILGERLGDYVKRAVKAAGIALLEDVLPEEDGIVFVLRQDMPLIKTRTLEKILRNFEKMDRDCLFYTRQKARLNGGIYLVRAGLYRKFKESGGSSFEDFVSFLISGKYFVKTLPCGKKKELLIVRNCQLQAQAANTIKKRINKKHLQAGVVLADKTNTYIGPNVSIEPGAVILPGTVLEGETTIGRGCQIGPNTRITDSEVGRDTTIAHSVVIKSKIGKATEIGPFAYLRPNSFIGDHVKIGDFVEIKNAVIGNYTKASHLSYIGDADLGEYINIGCGTITVNYDGRKKSRTLIEDGAFIGCNTNLVAPVTVKKGAFVAAGSTITEEVPEDALGIARARQVNKTTWKRK